MFGPSNVFLVSKVRIGGRMHKRTEQWLHEVSGFFEKTNVPKANIVFVGSVSGPDGKGTAAARLGLSHFVDDKWEVLQSVFSDAAGNSGDLVRHFNGVLFHFASGGAGQWKPKPPSNELGSYYWAAACWSEVLKQLHQGRGGQQEGIGLQAAKIGVATLVHRVSIGIEEDASFGVIQRLHGDGDENFKYIAEYLGGTQIYLNGHRCPAHPGLEQESLEPLAVYISAATNENLEEALTMVEDLLADIRMEYTEFRKRQV